MPFIITRNDITKIKADAIVNPTDSDFSHLGSIDKRIHDLAGEELDEKCKEKGHLEVGDAYITSSYNFKNCKYIIHTCGPIYKDGKHHEEELLASCYKRCLALAKEYQLKSITFPLISSGTFGFPKGKALEIARNEITSFLEDEDMTVNLLVYDKEAFDTSKRLFKEVKNFLKKITKDEERSYSFKFLSSNSVGSALNNLLEESIEDKEMVFGAPSFEPDLSFGEYLIELIDERKLKDSEVYKKANINRDVFNKIINGKTTIPKKKTCVALAVALKLDVDDTNELLSKAGYVLSESFVFDKIILYCLKNNEYNIFNINEILFENDQEILA